ncbi:MAG: CotH kinase family protein, partial [Verrucomicrobiales bacterium]
LNYTADDGVVVWINGVEVERRRFLDGEAPTIDDTASATGTEGDYETRSIINPGAFLVEGSNTIAVQLFNASTGSSDLGFDLQIFRPGEDEALPIPSPGSLNTASANNAAPNIRKVGHTPAQPAATDPVVVTAKVTDPQGVQSVNLEYQVVTAGNYVPSKLPLPIVGNNINTALERPDNPEYATAWTTVAMNDSGSGGDALPGDDIFSVTLPAQAHRTLVRYRITVVDGLDLGGRVPYADDESLNFAYFVYDGVPAYEGTDAATMADTLPVYHLITRSEDYAECIAYNSADRINQGTQARFFYNWSATIVYDGKVYDNIRYRLRGANGRYQSGGKRSMRFRMNEGRFLQARDHSGKKYSQKWRTLTLGKCSSNRLTLTYGLNEVVNFYLFNKVGVPGANAQWLHWRVIDEADEDPDRSGGDFHGFYLTTETYDVRFLEEHKLEKGNLYKLINQTGDWEQQQRYQAAFAPADGADHNTIEQQLDGGDSADYIGAHVNLDKWNRSHALVQAIRHYDYWPSANKNMVYYFEPDYQASNDSKGKLWILPWDTDATWGPTYNSGHDVVYNSLFAAGGGGSDANSTPELWPAYYNEVRELRDLLWQPDQIDPLVDEFASFIAPLEAADASRWQNSPAADGNYNGLHGPGKSSHAAYVQDMKNFAFVGGSWDGGGVGAGGRAAFLDSLQASNGEGGRIPDTPTITYTGTAGYPTNGISFQSSAFTDPQGNGSFAAMEWRIAQVTDPDAPMHDPTERFKLEIDADWESGELSTFASAIDIPTVAVRSGLTYRARVRHQDATGRWSHWSAPVEFTTTLPDISDYLAGLVVTEVMYHPSDPSAAEITAGFDDDDSFEYIELKNVGSKTLDLKDLRFTKGVDFDFLGAAITTLAPGEIVLVANNLAAFEMRYGAGLPVAGSWQSSDKLDNGGEQVKLSFGAGDPIRDFTYDDAAPWPVSPDGSGPSLTLQQPATVPDHALATSWLPSSSNGTPGLDDVGITYTSWREAIFGPGNPPGSGELDDPDSDGVVNLFEYSGGTDPLNASSVAGPAVGIAAAGADEFPTITYTRRRDRTDLSYLVEVSTDLASWDSGVGFTVQVGAPVNNGDGSETVTVRSLRSIGSSPRQHLRIAVAAQ